VKKTQKYPVAVVSKNLLVDIRSLIESARTKVAHNIDHTLVLLNWHIGKRIREDILKDKRADYGQQIVPTLSALLIAEYGRGYSEKNIFKRIFVGHDDFYSTFCSITGNCGGWWPLS
jgi:hypothetical protein